MRLRLKVLIPTIGRIGLLSRTLNSLANAVQPPELDTVFVLENGEEQSIEPSQLEEYSLPIQYRYLPITGKSKTVQSALESIGQGFAIFLDDDVRVSREFLAGYVNKIKHHSVHHIYGGPSCPEYQEGEEPPEWLMPYLPDSAKGWNKNSDSPWFLGHNFGLFVSDVLESGGFDTSLGPGANSSRLQPVADETELQKRLAERGFSRVYIAEAKVWHWVPKQRCSVEWALRRMARNGFTLGLQRQEKSQEASVFGVPIWMLREVSREALRYCRSYFI